MRNEPCNLLQYRASDDSVYHLFSPSFRETDRNRAGNQTFFEGETDQYSVKFDLNGLMRGDTAARSEWYRTSIQNGIHSRNEIRQMEGYPRLEGLDDMLYPSNMTIVGQENQDKNEDEFNRTCKKACRGTLKKPERLSLLLRIIRGTLTERWFLWISGILPGLIVTELSDISIMFMVICAGMRIRTG